MMVIPEARVGGWECLSFIVPLKSIEYGFGYIIIRSPYTLYSIYLRGTIGLVALGLGFRA